MAVLWLNLCVRDGAQRVRLAGGSLGRHLFLPVENFKMIYISTMIIYIYIYINDGVACCHAAQGKHMTLSSGPDVRGAACGVVFFIGPPEVISCSMQFVPRSHVGLGFQGSGSAVSLASLPSAK